MHFTYKYRCMVNRLEMSTFKTSLNWFGDVDVPEIWASFVVTRLLLFSLCGEAAALAGMTCGGEAVDGEMPRDNSKCLGKHI